MLITLVSNITQHKKCRIDPVTVALLTRDTPDFSPIDNVIMAGVQKSKQFKEYLIKIRGIMPRSGITTWKLLTRQKDEYTYIYIHKMTKDSYNSKS